MTNPHASSITRTPSDEELLAAFCAQADGPEERRIATAIECLQAYVDDAENRAQEAEAKTATLLQRLGRVVMERDRLRAQLDQARLFLEGVTS